MIHILKSRSGYRVRYSGKNGEPLAVSEVLTSKANAWKNVRAMGYLYNRYARCVVIDETEAIKKWWSLWVDTESRAAHKRQMQYNEIHDYKKFHKIKQS